MADRIRFSVNITPIETLTDENAQTHDIIASEVKKSLGGSGDSVAISDYSGTAANQGYLNATVNYKVASHSTGGTALSATVADCIFIKNTGYKFSAATTLGASTTDCVMIVAKIIAQSTSVNGGYVPVGGTPDDAYVEIAWLKPGQAIILPLASSNLSITQFGDTNYDLIGLNGDTDYGGAYLFARTYQSDGSAAASGNAIEYLVVT